MQLKILRLSLLLIIFLTPLIPGTFGFGYESIKVLIFLVLTIFVGIIFISLLSVKKIVVQWDRTKIAALVFLGILTLTSILGINSFESLMGKYPYYQGLILYWFLFLFFLMVSTSALNWRVLCKVISVSALIVAVVAIFQFIRLHFLGLEIPTYAGRVVSTFGQPNFYSGFLLLSLPLTYYLIKNGRVLWIYLLIFLISLSGILISFSRIAIVLAVVFTFFSLVQVLPKFSRILISVLWILLVVSGGIFFLNNFSGMVYHELIEPKENLWLLNNSPEKRVLIWPEIINLSLQKPFLGYGLENLNQSLHDYLKTFNPAKATMDPAFFTLKDLNLDRSHNYFLDLLVFSGILGLLTYLVFVLWILQKGRKSPVLLAALILYLVWIQFQNQSLVHLMFFWLVAGVVDSKLKIDY